MNTAAIRIRRLQGEEAAAAVPALADVLIDCVAGGASVSFMWPLPRDKALAFWQRVAAGVSRGERVLLVAEDEEGHIVGTAQLVLDLPDNQPHRADVAKMLVHRRARRRGIAAQLLAAIDQAARTAGRTVLVLDTVTGGDAERLYARAGWQRVGVVPGYALMPDGALCGTTFFHKQLGPAGSAAQAGRVAPGGCRFVAPAVETAVAALWRALHRLECRHTPSTAPRAHPMKLHRLALSVLLPFTLLAAQPACADPAAARLLGSWTVDLRPTPQSPAYLKKLVITAVDGNRIEGHFYDGSPLQAGRVNSSGAVVPVFAFFTDPGEGAYQTSGRMVAPDRLEGMTLSTTRGFLLPWTAVRDRAGATAAQP